MSELKPCPFCGGNNVYNAETVCFGRPSRWAIICCDCSARMERSTKRKAIEAWNRRADNAKAATIKKFADMLKDQFDRYGVDYTAYAIVDDVVKEMGVVTND